MHTLYQHLTHAFGGASQIPEGVIGQAIVGTCNNGSLSHEAPSEWKELLDSTLAEIAKGDDEREAEARRFILEGAAEACRVFSRMDIYAALAA